MIDLIATLVFITTYTDMLLEKRWKKLQGKSKPAQVNRIVGAVCVLSLLIMFVR